MSIKKSNLYAEKIFAEHPLALWPLDDDISYIQLFDMSSSATTIKRKNLITNPTLSSAASGWSASANTSLSYSASGGTITNSSGSTNLLSVYFNSKMYVETNNKHTFSIYARNSASARNMKAIIKWYKYANQWVPTGTAASAGYYNYYFYQSGLSEGTVTSVGTSTTRVSVTDYPQGSFAEVYLVTTSGIPVGESIFLSKAVFEDNDLTDFYFDGSQSDSSNINILSRYWNGASANSTSFIEYQVGYQDRQTANFDNTTYWNTGPYETSQRRNLISNPSFEVGTTGYSTQGAGTTQTRITTDAFSGSACLEVTKAAVSLSGTISPRATVVGSTPYTGTAYVKIPTGQEAGGLRVQVSWWDSVGGNISNISGTTVSVTSASGWVRVSVTATSPSNAVEASLRIHQPTAGTAGQKFLVDAIMLEQSSSVNEYFDGSVSPSSVSIISNSWSGTAHSSISIQSIGVRQLLSLTAVDYGIDPIEDTTNYRYQSSASTSLIRSKVPIKTGTNGSSDSLFDRSKSTGCFSTFVYSNGLGISSMEIGTMSGSAFVISSSSSYTFDSTVGWKQISHTFTIPDNTDLYLYIRTYYSTAGGSSSAQWITQFSGTSLGQWSEPYNGALIGFTPETIPEDILHLVNDSSYYSVRQVDAYGLDTSQNGYYLIKNKNYFARTSGIPMVYGSDHTTKVFEATDRNPSIIIPGFGFLNESGKYNNYTFEAWIRADNYTLDPTRIIGPVASDDGVYIEEGFISLKIGPYYKSYFVGKWARPMLLHVTYTQSEVTLMINGEQVISIPIPDISLITTFPSYSYDESEYTNDWIGIYGNNKIDPFEIDSISILPYVIPSTLAKRRFVFGQGSGEINISNSKATGDPFVIDYAASQYAVNMIYPDMQPWGGNATVNLDASQSYLTTPQLDLPEINTLTGTITSDEWLQYNFYQNIYQKNDTDYPFFKMQPPLDFGDIEVVWGTFTSASPALGWSSNTQWVALADNTWIANTYIFDKSVTTLTASAAVSFGSLKVINDNVQSFMLILESSSASVSSASTQSLISFKNNVTNEIFDVVLNNTNLSYRFNNNVLKTETIGVKQKFIVGINFSEIANQYYLTYPSLKTFFKNQADVSINVGGNFTESFAGKIYALHFNNKIYHDKDFAQFFLSSSPSFAKQISTTVEFDYLVDYIGNYSLKPKLSNSTMYFDIGVAGYWEDTQQLTYFAKYVTDENGQSIYALDQIQFNIDIPIDPNLNNYETFSEYQSLYTSYSASDASMRVYMTFQNSASVGTMIYSSLSTQYIGSDKIIEFDETKYSTTKYEIVDNSVIVIPSTMNIDQYYLGFHVEFRINGISQKQAIVKSMQLSSFVINKDVPTKIGGRHYKDVYPFTKVNGNINYSIKNPITTYKGSTPYLYLTSDSGLFKNNYLSASPDTSQGFYYVINEQEASQYYCGGVQTWIRYPETSFSNSMVIMSINVGDNQATLTGYPEDNGKRMRVDIATDSNFVVYQDGIIVNKIYLSPREWSSINISFKNPSELDGTGTIEFYRGFLFNNMFDYHYYPKAINQLSSDLFITWNSVWYPPPGSASTSWLGVFTSSSVSWFNATDASFPPEQVPVDSSDVYNSQIGLSNTVIEDDSRISITSNGVTTFTDVSWKLYEAIPI